jgi:hypothetical protein
MAVLDTEWEFYEANREGLVEKYCGKYVVISGENVVAAYDDQKTAYLETIKTIPLGSFMIHHIAEEEEVVSIFGLLYLQDRLPGCPVHCL